MIKTIIIAASLSMVFNSPSHASVLRDSTGLVLGTMEYVERSNIAVSTIKGYMVFVESDSGKVDTPDGSASIYFLDSTCSGTAYAVNVYIRPLVFSRYVPETDTYEIMSISADAIPVVMTEGQVMYWQGSNQPGGPPCIPWPAPAGTRQYLTPMAPNDPIITGIGNGPFLPPFTISMSSLFLDGFDGT